MVKDWECPLSQQCPHRVIFDWGAASSMCGHVGCSSESGSKIRALVLVMMDVAG
jgi:hypothetical protein